MMSSFSFEIFPKHSQIRYREPDVAAYLASKQVRMVATVDEDGLAGFDCLPLPDPLKYSGLDPLYLQRSWFGFWGRRLSASLRGDLPKITSLFPGYVLPSANVAGTRYRGSLSYEQYTQTIPTKPMSNRVFLKESTDPLGLWPWYSIERPKLFEVVQTELNSDNGYHHAEMSPYEIRKRLNDFLASEPLPIEELLKTIHAAWSNTAAPHYEGYLLETAKGLIDNYRYNTAPELIMRLAFELEAMASFLTFTQASNVIGSGHYAGNWIEVEKRSIAALRATELCESDRLMDELLNLSGEAFAPIIVNEYDCVADGNHRLVALWIWRLLSECIHCPWSLDNTDFERAVSHFVHRNEEVMGFVALHQTLTHLAVFLNSPEYLDKLLQLRPIAERSPTVSTIPVMLLPEYSSPTVLKAPYDRDNQLIRFSPAIYMTICHNPALVLPARTPYHFTDCALLPWFNVIQEHSGQFVPRPEIRPAELLLQQAI